MFNHAPADYACPFCLLVQGVENEHVLSTQSDIVYHGNAVTALIGSHQWPKNAGSVLVIPNEHFENLYDLPLSLATKIHALARATALAMKHAYQCDGISTRQHNEPAGNQEVWHYHLHVFPRYHGDDLYVEEKALLPASERAKYARQLAAALISPPKGL